MAEAGRQGEERQRRVRTDDGQQGHRDQQWLAPETVTQHAADRQPDKVGDTDQQRHQKRIGSTQVEYGFAECRCIDGDQVKGGSGHRHHQHSGNHHTPVLQQRREHLSHGRTVRASSELFGFLQAAAQQENERDDQATDGKRNSPAPVGNSSRCHPLVQAVTQCSGDNDCHLLTT